MRIARSSLRAWEALFGVLLADPAGDGVACRKVRHKDLVSLVIGAQKLRFHEIMGKLRIRGVYPS